jgi:hypothetical protein
MQHSFNNMVHFTSYLLLNNSLHHLKMMESRHLELPMFNTVVKSTHNPALMSESDYNILNLNTKIPIDTNI